MFAVDEDTILYNIQIHQEYSLTNIALIKVIHLLPYKVMFLLTDSPKLTT